VRPIDDIVNDLKQLQQMGVRYVRFVDDNFRLGKRDLEQVCKRIIEEGINIRWLTFMRAASLVGVDMGLLKRSGCTEVQLGLESAHPDVLREMNKRSDPDTYFQVIESLLRTGINVATSFIFGFPGETEHTAHATVDFIKSIDFDNCEGTFFWWIFPFMLAPLSPVYEEKDRIKYGLNGYMHTWRHHTMSSKQAMMLINKAFHEIENSSQAYSADNLNLIQQMNPLDRRQFMLTRHQLSKVSLIRNLNDQEIYEAFGRFF
jgi:anaerobic magnesium-protoporphyrin IX monomethyl ester cyclase